MNSQSDTEDCAVKEPAIQRLRIVFFGTAEFACESLAALTREGWARVVGVVTQPDRPKGRALRLLPTPVKALATRLGLTIWQPERARKEEFVWVLDDLHPDLIVVAAYGQILPPAILELPPHGCLNVHASLLPKYRGAAPIQWAILNGETETGVTIMKMDAGLDTGDMVSTRVVEIAPDDDAQALHDRLAALGASLLTETIPAYVSGSLTPRPQPVEGVCYARKIVKEDGRLDWARPAQELRNRLRALSLWPGAFTYEQTGSGLVMLKLWRAEADNTASGVPGSVLRADNQGVLVACGDGALRVTELQREGGKRLSVAQYLAGHPLEVGTVFGNPPRPTCGA